ncbi:MAG TPA: hypothetical protein DCM87_03055 [Planctomycetes bacterium]|nr:hypothetical protein [Planctomycetota bacterium]
MQGDFLSWGLYVGRAAGISVRIHWTLLGWWLYELDAIVRAGGPLWAWLLTVGLSFGAILLHEFGHCAAARRAGGSADSVLLWPLGGLAMCRVPAHWKAELAVAAGGPLVTAAIALAGLGASLLLPSFREGSESMLGAYAYYMLVPYQTFLLLFNVLPVYPLDGGRMMHAGLRGLLGRFGRRYDAHSRATTAVVWSSRIVAAGGIVYGVAAGQFLLLCIAAWCLLETQRLLAARDQEEEEDWAHAAGYDFSRGYAGLGGEAGEAAPRESWWRRARRKARTALWRRRLRRHAAVREAETPRAPADAGAETGGGAGTPEERERVDALLAKISAEGLAALTPEERAFLDATSRRWSTGR